MSTPIAYDIVSQIARFEEGGMEYEEVRELFQRLMDTGLIHGLQGSYGRLMNALIENGEVTPR